MDKIVTRIFKKLAKIIITNKALNAYWFKNEENRSCPSDSVSVPSVTLPVGLFFPLAYLAHSSIFFLILEHVHFAVPFTCGHFVCSKTFTLLSPSCHSSLISTIASLVSPSHHTLVDVLHFSDNSYVLYVNPCWLPSCVLKQASSGKHRRA